MMAGTPKDSLVVDDESRKVDTSVADDVVVVEGNNNMTSVDDENTTTQNTNLEGSNNKSPLRKRQKISSDNTTPKENDTNGNTTAQNNATATTPSFSNDDDDDDAKSKSKKKSATSKQQDKEDMAWICADCKEAECGLVTSQSSEQNGSEGDYSFLICDGPCHRIFHVPCAGLNQLPPSDEDWFCKDCLRQEHACAYCQLPGVDNVDVFPCQDELCGLFFHEACLETHQVEYSYQKVPPSPAVGNDKPPSTTIDKADNDEYKDNDDDDEDEIIQLPIFTCPAHHCWTCTQKDMVQLEKDEDARAQKESYNRSKKRKKKKQSIFQSKNGRLYVSTCHVWCTFLFTTWAVGLDYSYDD